MTNPTPRYRGLVLRDATEPFEFTPAARDVRASIGGDAERCVLARAAHRVKGVRRVFVERTRMIVEYDNEPGVGYRYSLDGATRTAVAEFDDSPEGVRRLAAWIAGRKITGHVMPASARLGYKRGQSGSDRRSGTSTRRAVYDRSRQTRGELRPAT